MQRTLHRPPARRPSRWSVRCVLLCAATSALGCSDEPDPLQPCVDAVRQRDNPRTMSETVEHINALPFPVGIPCVLASLKRPLDVVATRSLISAQPAVGARSPRLFVLLGAMELSVVPAGDGAPLLEFGEFVSPQDTVKAELHMPLDAPVGPSEPFRQVLYEPGSPATGCGFCHHAEVADREVDGVIAYRSVALRPHDNLDVPLFDVAQQSRDCDEQQDAERCEMLRAVFDFGEVRQGAFSEDLPQMGD